ncbi:uncharacterized protein LOC132723082 [Ruditapes philippinarum]|uniref:uncharacterized protein LOC132723082 n=1 Tax=Ruditapes philippinarum TaxID=129788 RepID=UPI00295A9018|nr:uncharacterized protein LOC132723082 [Ruditapes philippinarum]
MGKKNKKIKKDVFSAFCDKHSTHAIEMFCVDCDKVVCVICLATEHKSDAHTKILTIEEASTDCAKTKEFLEYEDKLNTVFTRETKTLADNGEVNTITDQLKEVTESLIKKHKQDMIDLIEKHYKMLYERHRLKYEESKKRLLSVNEQLCKNENKTSEIRQEINAKKESGQNVALFIAMKKSQDNVRQIEIELEEIEKLNFVERYELQAGHMVIQLLEEEKEFGDLLVTASTSPKVPPRELKPRGVLVLPCQSKAGGQEDVAEEDELDGYEPVGQIDTAGSDDDQETRTKSSPRRDSTQSLNTVFTEETNEQERLSGDNFKNPNTGMYQ